MGTTLSLHATLTPDVWPGDAACDVVVRLVLRNEGGTRAAASPALAKLGAIASYAGIGITWNIGFVSDAAQVPLQELRRWHGPPGNPPSPEWARQQSVEIEPGAEHVTELMACWIPNRVLEPRHLSTAALDPEGMDQVDALASRIPLATASVLVFGMRSAELATTADDVLRGHVVAFFTQPGTYEVHAQYAQMSWMGVGDKFQISAAPVSIHVR